ncbi:MAG: hypothetical protein COV91_01625 [Candidatus Taylorbacteria bacterium CG11_big_fil_rev_8_21_14_0_20_46_11]|uniref:Uncharacterized protein n=1 Tax=Candidatus Taylorbacteria bacterium CG11_big_fil_rev_8_21_14_0_20_46_11 TaxID=1975025 RepID=A0A2H0KCB4_9BACT|nr:MAG: hypothetical protein COV91_01625 [Candidatus Taylorbacteria bacterium CG11_big_fil_rev_8_21_14_0_20_46_11]
MNEIKPTIFTITKEEIEKTVKEMIEEEILEVNLKLKREQIVDILACVEGDELLAKDIRMSIRGSIREALFE